MTVLHQTGSMTSVATAVFKASIGLLLNKRRDLAVEKLNDGDVTDQQFNNLIAREINDIRSKIDGLARKDLAASFSFFKEGVECLYKLFDQTTSGEFAKGTARAATGTDEDKVVASLPSSPTDEQAKQALCDAKLTFVQARKEATRVFSNKTLKTSDRILAMTIRVMATLLEKVENPATALASCRVCLDELHNMPAVQNSFKVELAKGFNFKALFNRNERGEVIVNVLHLNIVICTVTQMVSGSWFGTLSSPCIDIGNVTIDPLRDARLVRRLPEFNMEHCGTPVWSFGQEGEVQSRLGGPTSITTNTQGQFIVLDKYGRNVKVFNTSGKFLYSLCPHTSDNRDNKLNFLPC